MKKEINLKTISVVVLSCLIGAIMLYMIMRMVRFGEGTENRQAQSIERIIRKAAVQCYALEGEYPPDVAYLSENYGVILDEKRYFYFYDVSMGNMMPDIQVIPKGVPAGSEN